MTFLQQRIFPRNSADDGTQYGFRPIGALVEELVRKLWRNQHSATPCPLDRSCLVVIDGGRQ